MKIYIDVSKIKIFQMELLENFMVKNDIEYARIYTIESIDERDKEIERLNNIINELEKILDENVELTYVHNGKRQYNKTLTEGGLLFRDYIKSKLQELKGNNNGVWVNNLLEVIKENNIEFGSDKE